MTSPIQASFIPETSKSNTTNSSLQNFSQNFSTMLHLEISKDEKLATVSSPYLLEMHDVISQLVLEGKAERTGMDDKYRVIFVSVQGAIEEALAKQLRSNEIKSVKAVVLTPLPCTPLRKMGNTGGLSAVPFEPSRQYTLDKREHTFRQLMEAGGEVFVVYSKKEYEALRAKTDEDSKKQVDIYEGEKKKHVRLKSVELENVNIPKELSGAIYLITDCSNNQYYLATQGIQASEVSKQPGVWAKWFASADKESGAKDRARKMLDFISSSQGPSIGF